jgi:pimeloyl-ACP methyl ester carboxylesterase
MDVLETMGKNSKPSEITPTRTRRHPQFALFFGLVSLVSLYHVTARGWPQFRHHCSHNHHRLNSPYGSFPRADDAFRLLPCTNETFPPALDDPDHEASWAKSFDPNPEHWAWGNNTAGTTEDSFSGRGIFLCGYIDVPLDYKNGSETRIIRLAVTKFQVSGLARADGSSPPGAGTKSQRTLVLEPGGPGGSGTRMAWASGELLTERFTHSQYDVLGWDPRGVNASQPAISCYPYNADRDRWSALTGQYPEQHSDPETQLRTADAMNNATFHACWKRHGDLGRFMTTTLVARDLEEIRKGLGEEDLTGYLVSYGTGIGQTYANMFPDRVGRIILDGTEYVRDHRLLGGFVGEPHAACHLYWLPTLSESADNLVSGVDRPRQCDRRLPGRLLRRVP